MKNVYDEILAKQSTDLAVKWHTCDIMGLGGGEGPRGASPGDLQGWSSLQVRASMPRCPGAPVPRMLCMHRVHSCRPHCPPPHPPLPKKPGSLHPQVVAFLDKLRELRSMQPLHPSITRKCALPGPWGGSPRPSAE